MYKMDNELCEDNITFGKYKDLTLTEMLRDRSYCNWVVNQDWFEKQYPYLYNRVMEHVPQEYFMNMESLSIEDNSDLSAEEFLQSYEYFHLMPISDLKIELTDIEKSCYTFYLEMIDLLKNKIIKLIEKGELNPYDIKAPTGWLKRFEKESGLSRNILKEFLSAYELKNLPYIIEDIKKMGGIDYKGARSFLIAKEKSKKQEEWWEEKLNTKYGEDIGTQFSFRGCQFDAIYIREKILYEMKLGLKDFNEDQHKKYLATVGTTYKIIYLIGTDCVVNLQDKKVYTTTLGKYYAYILGIPKLKKPSKFDRLIETFEVVEVNDILEYI